MISKKVSVQYYNLMAQLFIYPDTSFKIVKKILLKQLGFKGHFRGLVKFGQSVYKTR